MTFPGRASLKGLERCDRYAAHASELLNEKLGRGRARSPNDIPRDIQIELENIVDRFHRAWLNPVQVPYRLAQVQEIVLSKRKDKDALLRTLFPGPFPENQDTEEGGGQLRVISKPTLFVDQDGKAIGWFFPNTFTARRSEHVVESVKALSNVADSILSTSLAALKQRQGNWRFNDSAYTKPEHCTLTPGHVNMSLCWYNLGHGPGNKKPPSPSASLKPMGGGSEFLAAEIDTNALIGVLLSLVHPELYSMQMEVLRQLRCGKLEVRNAEHMHTLFDHWSTPFTAFALIVNRETEYHRDTKGGHTLMDVLATFGRYTSGRLNVPLLGSRFIYNPGTTVVIPGHLLEHGASRALGERVCFASFFRPNVGCGVLGDAYTELGPPNVDELGRRLGLIPQTIEREV